MEIPYKHPAWIEIDLSQFQKNIDIIRLALKNSRLCLPVKANAYGHGLTDIGRAAAMAQVDYLAVSCLQEGAQLRESGITIPILVMGAIHENQIGDLINHNLEFTISSAYKAKLTQGICQKENLRCRVHIEVDTGMQRTGMHPATALALLQDLRGNHTIEVIGAYSHLATGDKKDDSFALRQIEQFQEFRKKAHAIYGSILFHIGNSGGICHYPSAELDMVRPGLLAFGYFDHDLPPFSDIKPFFSLKAKIAYFKVVEKDQGISYGHSFHTKRRTRIVTIPVGYGDGFRRALSNKASVLIRGKAYPIVGMICMDQLMVDIGDDEAYVGEEAVLIGRLGENEILLKDIAQMCDTIPYEILCSFNQRLPRFYIHHSK